MLDTYDQNNKDMFIDDLFIRNIKYGATRQLQRTLICKSMILISEWGTFSVTHALLASEKIKPNEKQMFQT